MPKWGVVVFPGSNCDRDCYYVVRDVFDQEARYIWHKEEELGDIDCLILPGGFSYGDYLRTGAIARFSPIMNAVKKFAMEGGILIGICNGFQILLEAGLLPGAMLVNKNLRFICRYVYLRVENNQTLYTNACVEDSVLKIPIAHYEGNYYADQDTLAELIDNNQILLKYCNWNGESTSEDNPNGSILNIAGLINKEGNVAGMMPHPERASEEVLGSIDGGLIFKSILNSVNRK
ncbi:MAG: phosphoribosylformylglycinamidine synthase subunit PurQ [bacterium]|nr:phosphoribosylformylglycinamidine synthase subunit PurQ [bacterium]